MSLASDTYQSKYGKANTLGLNAKEPKNCQVHPAQRFVETPDWGTVYRLLFNSTLSEPSLQEKRQKDKSPLPREVKRHGKFLRHEVHTKNTTLSLQGAQCLLPNDSDKRILTKLTEKEKDFDRKNQCKELKPYYRCTELTLLSKSHSVCPQMSPVLRSHTWLKNPSSLYCLALQPPSLRNVVELNHERSSSKSQSELVQVYGDRSKCFCCLQAVKKSKAELKHVIEPQLTFRIPPNRFKVKFCHSHGQASKLTREIPSKATQYQEQKRLNPSHKMLRTKKFPHTFLSEPLPDVPLTSSIQVKLHASVENQKKAKNFPCRSCPLCDSDIANLKKALNQKAYEGNSSACVSDSTSQSCTCSFRSLDKDNHLTPQRKPFCTIPHSIRVGFQRDGGTKCYLKEIQSVHIKKPLTTMKSLTRSAANRSYSCRQPFCLPIPDSHRVARTTGFYFSY